ncbi:hypothetical protein [Streptomyces drozdowiczii]
MADGVNVSLMGLVEHITDPQKCSAQVCRDPAILWFETFQSTRRYYACRKHALIMAENVALASSTGGKVI